MIEDTEQIFTYYTSQLAYYGNLLILSITITSDCFFTWTFTLKQYLLAAGELERIQVNFP